MGISLTSKIAKGGVQAERPAQLGVALLVVAEQRVYAAEGPMNAGLAKGIARAAGGTERSTLGDKPLVQMPSPVEEVNQRPGNLPGMGIQARSGRQGDGRPQDLVLGVKPGKGLLTGGEAFGCHPGLAPHQGDGPAAGVE